LINIESEKLQRKYTINADPEEGENEQDNEEDEDEKIENSIKDVRSSS
jgi:hypothetical protein